MINKVKKKHVSVFGSSPGEFPLIGASASCSSYQKPRRGRGRTLAGVTGIKDPQAVTWLKLVFVDVCFTIGV
jgi:hypothetical protein